MLASDKHWMVGWMVLYVKGQLHTFSLIISPYLKSNMLPHTHRMTPLSSVPLVLGGLWLKVEDLVSPDPPAFWLYGRQDVGHKCRAGLTTRRDELKEAAFITL